MNSLTTSSTAVAVNNNNGSHHNGNGAAGAGNPNYVLTQIVSKYNLKDAVKLPVAEDPNEWIAYNIFDFHKQICMLYGTVSEFCTLESCPRMSAGKKYEYLWSNGPQNELVNLTASEYIHHLLDRVQEQLDDRSVFPTQRGAVFPPNYMEICRTISKRLLRVYAHIHYHHSKEVLELQERAHMNTSLKHFIYFVQEFQLIAATSEPSSDLDLLNQLCTEFKLDI